MGIHVFSLESETSILDSVSNEHVEKKYNTDFQRGE